MIYIQSTTSALENLLGMHQVNDMRQHLIASIKTVQSDLYAVGTPLGTKIDSIIDHVSLLRENAARCSGCHHKPEVVKRLEDMQKDISDYQDALSYYITASADREKINRLQLNAAEIGNRILAETEDMSQNAAARLALMTGQALERARIVRTALIMTVLLTFVFALMMAFRLARSILQPIDVLVKATRAIASGNLDYVVAYKDRTEFGELAHNFNEMSSALKDGYLQLEEDIAKRRKAEEALWSANVELKQEVAQRRQVEEALKESERRFRETLEGANLIALQLDIEGRIIFANEYLAHLTNRNLADIVGQNWFDLFIPETQKEAMRRIHSQNTSGELLAEYAGEIMESHGSRLLVSWTSSRMMDDAGNISGITALGMDITHRRQIEEYMLNNQKLEAVGRLAGGIAHDFNNLLQGIFGFIAMAKLNSDKNGKPYDYLSQAEQSLDIATNLTNQLLTFSKGGRPVKKIIELTPVILNAVRLGLSGSRTDHRILCEDDLWHVEADAGQVGQVIQNIIINARDAMPQGGTITISTGNVMNSLPNMPEGRYVRITIEDTGSGIPEEHLRKIFDPYFSTKQTGSGLGLATAYSIMRNHGGTIDVSSVPGKGTTFSIYLPAAAEGAAADQAAAETAASDAKGRILVMDDEEIILRISCDMLKALGHEAVTAKNGEEAVSLYSKAMSDGKKFDMVILDLTIRGGMGGTEANERLHEIDPQVKTIISSGYSDDATISKYMELGFYGYLKKPYRISELKNLLSTLL